MTLIKSDYLIRIFSLLTDIEHEVEFVVNEESAVVMNVIENKELLSATLFSVHDSQDDANKARDLYEGAFAIYREAMIGI